MRAYGPVQSTAFSRELLDVRSTRTRRRSCVLQTQTSPSYGVGRRMRGKARARPRGEGRSISGGKGKGESTVVDERARNACCRVPTHRYQWHG